MKNIVTFLTGCFIVSLILTSCSSNTSIVKRHYTKGYYVNWGKSKPNVAVANAENRPAQARVKTPIQALPIKENFVTNDLTNAPEPMPNIVTIKMATHKTSTQHSTKQPLNNTITKLSGQSFESQPTMSPASEGSRGDEGARAALSLLWIVILVILILWLIGIIAGGFGLGGLINVLLVIALVLLILWILRII